MVLEAVLQFVGAIQATNVFNPERIGQSFRIDPTVLPDDQFLHKCHLVYFTSMVVMAWAFRFVLEPQPVVACGFYYLDPVNNMDPP